MPVIVQRTQRVIEKYGFPSFMGEFFDRLFIPGESSHTTHLPDKTHIASYGFMGSNSRLWTLVVRRVVGNINPAVRTTVRWLAGLHSVRWGLVAAGLVGAGPAHIITAIPCYV